MAQPIGMFVGRDRSNAQDCTRGCSTRKISTRPRITPGSVWRIPFIRRRPTLNKPIR